MSDHVNDDVYSLAQGPIHLARGKREREEEKAFAKSGKYHEIKALLVCCGQYDMQVVILMLIFINLWNS